MCTKKLKNPMSVGLSAVLRCVCASVFTWVPIQKNIDTNDAKKRTSTQKNALPKLSAGVKLFV